MADEQNVITGDGTSMPRIVAGVHGTPASDAALDWAAREARLRRAHLHLVLARDPAVSRRAPYAHPAAPTSFDADTAWLAGAAVRAARTLPQRRVSTELADGLPARVLADRAAGASLLVLGAAPAGFLGPVARACLRQAPCPVVIVVPDSRPAPAAPRPRLATDRVAGLT
jgi:nucleotide-binding universal stress UspA family protein